MSRKIFLAAIILLAVILRFYKINESPPSLNIDEVSNGYNAYSILKSARDEYGNFLPLTFRAFGDYNLPLSVYTLVPSIAVFGLNEIGVRFPSALLGSVSVLTTYFIVAHLIKGSKTALLSCFFLAISPWHLQFSRYDHEANFMITFSLLGLLFFRKGLKEFKFFSLSALFFGLALITYHGAKIWIPLFITLIVITHFKDMWKLKSRLIAPAIIFFSLTLPIIFSFQQSLIRAQSVGIFQKGDALQTFINGYLSHYSPNFFFIFGDFNGRHTPFGVGELYMFEAPLILFGLLALSKLKTKSSKFIIGWFLLAAIPAAFADLTPHALRSVTFHPTLAIISAVGLIKMLENRMILNKIVLTGFILIAAHNIFTYLHIYYKHYPIEKGLDWADGYKEMITSVGEIQENYTSIAITNYYGHPYIYTLFYLMYEPEKYHPYSEVKTAFDKFEFFDATWEKTKPGKALVVASPWQGHPQKVLKKIYGTNGDLRFTIAETDQ